jgi:PAS domain S-box-containing protein
MESRKHLSAIRCTIGLTMESLRNSGIQPLGNIPWGTHFCLFYETDADLTEVSVSYLAAGMEQHELCFWLVAAPLTVDTAKEALRRAVPDFDRYESNGAVRFEPVPDWLLREGRIDADYIGGRWEQLAAESARKSFAGLRAAGCQSWLQHAQWDDFHRYEQKLQEAVHGRPMLVLCAYPLQSSDAAGILDVADSHELAVVRRAGKWEVLETPAIRLRQLEMRNRQQAAVSELGQTAIHERNIGVVINQAVTLAAATLGTGRAILWQLRPEGGAMVLRSKVGWDELADELVLPIEPGTAVQRLIERNKPVAIIDLPGDTRLEKSWVLRNYGVATMLSVIIRGQEQPWGVLSVHSLTRRSFTNDDLEFLQSMANVLALTIEREAHEAAERHEKENLQTIFDNVPFLISFFDSTGRLVRANSEWERTLGWTAEEAARPDICEKLFPEPILRESARAFIAQADMGWRDFQVHARNGDILETSWARFSLSDRSSMLVALDVTERKRAEEHFRELAENIDEAFWVLSGDGEELLYLNRAGERLTGFSLQSLRGPRAWLKTFHPDDRELAWRGATGDAVNEDFRVVRPSGTVRWTRMRAALVRASAGRIVRICGITQDVTERKEAENERIRLLASQTAARATAESALARLHAIESITDSALGRVAFDELLRELLTRLRSALNADDAGVLLLNEERSGFVIRAHDGAMMPRVLGLTIPLDSPLAGRVLKEGRPLIAGDFAHADAPEWRKTMDAAGVSFAAGIGAPLTVEGKTIGVAIVACQNDRQFTEDELDLLRIVADRVAPAIERAGLSQRFLTIQEEYRRRIAIELHDELGQILTALKIDLDSKPAKIADAVKNVDLAMQTVRDLALELRPAMLDDLGLAAALRWYADRFAQQTGVAMHIAIDEVPTLPFVVATACFRVAQEALTNVARHASAQTVWLTLHSASSEIELTIRDDGSGFDSEAARARAAHGGSVGLVSMQERVSLAGGSIDIHSSPGGGTEVRARFPAGART